MVGEGISLGELTATIKRQEIIMNNVEDPEERIIDGNYIEKEDCWDEDDEDPDAWVPCHEIDLYDTEDEDK